MASGIQVSMSPSSQSETQKDGKYVVDRWKDALGVEASYQYDTETVAFPRGLSSEAKHIIGGPYMAPSSPDRKRHAWSGDGAMAYLIRIMIVDWKLGNPFVENVSL